MNIVYVIPEFPTEKEIGGLATYYDNIARLMADAGHEVVVFVLSNCFEDISYYPGILVKRVLVDLSNVDASIPGSYMRQWSKEMNKAVQAYLNEGHQIDIIQYANFMGYGLDRFDNIPTVVRVSSFRPLLRAADQEVFDSSIEYKSSKVPDFLEELSVIKADYIYGPSCLTADIIKRETGRKVEIIESPFYPREISTENILPKKIKEKDYIITFGTLKALKGAKVIGDSILEIMRQYPNLYWVFAGAEVPWEGAQGEKVVPSDYIKKRAGIHGERVIFLGKVEQQKLLRVVKEAKCCVLPSRVDNLPNTCIEAMALGKIVVGTRGASFEQLIEDGENGYLIERENAKELVNAVNRVMRLDKYEANQMEKLASKRIEKMAPQKVKEQLLELYQTVIKNQNCTSSKWKESKQYLNIAQKYNDIIIKSDSVYASDYLL